METATQQITIVSITEEKVLHRGEFGHRANPMGSPDYKYTERFVNLSDGGRVTLASLIPAMCNAGAIKTLKERQYCHNAKYPKLVQFLNERMNEETLKSLGL